MGTVGRWPWRSESAKKRVATYPLNLRRPKMDGAELWREAPDAQRGRPAGARRRRACVSVSGGARRADLGSSSTSRSAVRRVHPLNRRRLREPDKGVRVNSRAVRCCVATRARRPPARQTRLVGRIRVPSVMHRHTRGDASKGRSALVPNRTRTHGLAAHCTRHRA